MSAAWYNFSALGKMKAQLRKHGLPMPPMDWVRKYDLSELRDWVWGTRTEDFRIYHLEQYAQEAVEQPLGGYFMLGHDGYGINSYYLNVLVQYRFLTVLIQAPWGGVYSSGEVAIDDIKRRFRVLEQLLELVSEMERKGVDFPARLVVQQSSVEDPRWAWVEEGSPFFWREEFANAMTPALESLKQRYEATLNQSQSMALPT